MPARPGQTQAKRSTQTRRSNNRRRDALQRVRRWLLWGTFCLLALTALTLWASGQNSQVARWMGQWRNRPRTVDAAAGQRVGLIMGHQGFDSGAVCPDGLTEGEVVAQIASQVRSRLERAGAHVELLEEYDTRLDGYQAAVLVSIHADSCIDRSGFKVARSATSLIPSQEERLVACLQTRYAAATGLAFDWASITDDMTGYHAFLRVAPSTAAAIIETGFLGGDGVLLTRRQDLVARGIADGVLCYLEGGGQSPSH